MQLPLLLDDVLIFPQFFATIFAGVLIALAIQLILTALSVAFGITMVGDLKQTYVDSQVNPGDSDNKSKSFDQDYNGNTPMGVKVTTTFGIWSLITTSAALFTGTILALNLNFFENAGANVTIALVIWALFFIILFYLESRVISTVIGSLVTTVTDGLKSAGSLLSSTFQSSQVDKVNKMVEQNVQSLKDEFSNDNTKDEVADVLNKFLNKLDDKLPNYDTIKEDLFKMADKSSDTNTSGKWMAIQQVLSKAINESSSGSDKQSTGKIDQLKTVLKDVQEATKGESGIDKITAAVSKLSDNDKKQLDKKVTDFKEYLNIAQEEDLSIENLKKKGKDLVNVRENEWEYLSEKIQEFNFENVIKILDQNTNLEKSTIENHVETTVGFFNDLVQRGQNIADTDFKKEIENKVKLFLDGTNRKELDYNELNREFSAIIKDPKANIGLLKDRFSKFDQNTLKALVTNNDYIDEKDIDGVMENITKTMNSVSDKVYELDTKISEQYKILERKTVIAAENTRKTAASAAWWLVITAVVSAGITVLAAYVELV